jgi:hypothetical protein
MAATTKGLLDFAIYTIRRSSDLRELAARQGKGKFTEKKKWATGLRLFEQAKQRGEHLPIIFAGGERIDGLLYWAIVTDLQSSGESTSYSFANLRRLRSKPSLSSLTLKSTSKPLSNDFIRPYAIVHTPSYIRAA